SQLHALTQPTRDKASARAAIDSLRPGDGRSSFGELARAVRLTAESARTPIELHLFSDMQRSSLAASFTKMTLPDIVILVPHSGVKSGVPNWTVESVTAPSRLWGTAKDDPDRRGSRGSSSGGSSGSKRVQAVIAGYDTPAATRTASLIVNGKVAATQSVAVP